MTRLGCIFMLSWDSQGQVIFDEFPKFSNDEQVSEGLSLCSIALLNHLFATLSMKNVANLTTRVIQGIVDNHFYVSPINPVVRNIRIDLRVQKDYVYTILKPKAKLFGNNQEIEQAMVQAANNTIAKTLQTDEGLHSKETRTALYGQIVLLEYIVREAENHNENNLQLKERFFQTGVLFLNKFPQNFREDGLLEKYMTETNPQDLIDRLNNLPGHPDRPLYS